MENIGGRIKERRELLGLSQGELAKRLGLTSRNAVYQYEKHGVTCISTIRKIAEALDTSEYALMGLEPLDYGGIKERFRVIEELFDEATKDEQMRFLAIAESYFGTIMDGDEE